MSIVFEYTVVKGALGVGKWDLLKITASMMVQFFSLNLSQCWPLMNVDQTTDQTQLSASFKYYWCILITAIFSFG